MPHFGSRSTKGDLFVEYNVILPLEVSPETRRSKSFRFTIHPFLQLLGVIRITDIDDFFSLSRTYRSFPTDVFDTR